jgi:hypothetical protein
MGRIVLYETGLSVETIHQQIIDPRVHDIGRAWIDELPGPPLPGERRRHSIADVGQPKAAAIAR